METTVGGLCVKCADFIPHRILITGNINTRLNVGVGGSNKNCHKFMLEKKNFTCMRSLVSFEM